MRVLATGVPSSGTRYLTRLLAAGGADAVHLSQPDQAQFIEPLGLLADIQTDQPDELAVWFDMDRALGDFDAVVIVVRGRLAHDGSYAIHWCDMSAERADVWRQESFERLRPAFGHPKAIIVTYESLAVREERMALLTALGLNPEGADLEPWSNENAKHYNQHFEWWGRRLRYFDHPYNSARLNERTIEIPVVAAWLSDIAGTTVDPSRGPAMSPFGGLEVGNVLSHYGITGHRVVDRHEQGEGVENLDVFDIEGRYDWIVAISTIEHVRWDEQPRENDGAARAIAHLRSLLAPGGRMILTLPTGYHTPFDHSIGFGRAGATRACTIRRSVEDTSLWVQTERPTVLRYGMRTPWAEAVWIGEYDA